MSLKISTLRVHHRSKYLSHEWFLSPVIQILIKHHITRSYNYSLQFIIQFRCFHEHLDLFTEIKDRNVESLIKTPFGGRYCGKIPPRPRISLYKVNAILQNDVKIWTWRINPYKTCIIRSCFSFFIDTIICISDG